RALLGRQGEHPEDALGVHLLLVLGQPHLTLVGLGRLSDEGRRTGVQAVLVLQDDLGGDFGRRRLAHAQLPAISRMISAAAGTSRASRRKRRKCSFSRRRASLRSIWACSSPVPAPPRIRNTRSTGLPSTAL